jgi:hypothetical protein
MTSSRIDADAELDALVGRYAAIAVRDPDLNRCRALDRRHDAREFHQDAIAFRVDDAPAAAGDFAVDQLPTMGLERRQRTGFVLPVRRL